MLSARERSLARERLLYEQLLDALERAPGTAQALRRGAVRTRRAGLLRRARAGAGLVAPELRDAPGLRIERGRHPVVEAVRERAVRAQRPGACDDDRRMLVITGPNMGGKSHLHAPERADRAARAHRQLRAGGARDDRPDRPHPHPHRRRRRPRARAVDLHGRDERDQLHPPPRHRAIAGADGRDRPRHLDLRRPRARRGLRAAPGRSTIAPTRCSPRTTSN